MKDQKRQKLVNESDKKKVRERRSSLKWGKIMKFENQIKGRYIIGLESSEEREKNWI